MNGEAMPSRCARALAAIGACGALAVVAAAPAQAAGGAQFFRDGQQPQFDQALAERGLMVDSAEDFEDARGRRLLEPAPTGTIDDPLDTRTDNRFFRPGQIPAALRLQSNTDNSGRTSDNPVGLGGLAISRPSTVGAGSGSIGISSPFTQDGPASTDVISVDAAHEAYVLDASLVRFSFVEPGEPDVGGPLRVRVYGEDGAKLGSTKVDNDEVGPFLGVLAPEGAEIGRISVSEPGGSEVIHAVVAFDRDGGDDTGTRPTPNLIEDLLQQLGLG